jgi:hypothetical protein
MFSPSNMESNMAHLPVDIIPGRLFTVSDSGSKLVAEISDLTGFDLFKRLYDDACDAGFALRTTHSVTRWSLAIEERDSEGDIIAWHFNPTSESVTVNPDCEGWDLTVLND